MNDAPGWFGKLPSLGDFASRRLPADFVEAWDAWLAKGLADWRAADAAWLNAYLAAPAWCFLLGPQVVAVPSGSQGAAPSAWAGVLMPSVDRFGRYFPFTLATPLRVFEAADAPRLAHWLRMVASCAVDAMHGSWTPDRLEQALLELTDVTWPMPLDTGHGEFGELLERTARRGDTALWWLPDQGTASRPRQTRGLPSGAAFAHLLGGRAVDPSSSPAPPPEQEPS
jgi:type VI secretion system protein ImpM